MSHLCTMHRPPLSCERTGEETTLGRAVLGRVETTPFSPLQSTNNTSACPSTLRWHGDTFEESTFHVTPQFLTKKEEFSTYPSSGFCWKDTQHIEGGTCSLPTYFQVTCGLTVFSTEDQTRNRCFVASPVCSTGGAKCHSARSSRKGCTPKSFILS